MNSIKFIFYLIFAIIVLTLVALFYRGNEDAWICENGKWIIHGRPNSPMPNYDCGKSRDTEKINNLPPGYTIEKYTIEKSTGVSCTRHSDCITPNEYLLMSRCPFTSLCLNNKCNVVCPSYQQIPGGDRDEHGCIGSAGYSWCSVKNKCIRIWEESCSPQEIKKLIIKDPLTCSYNNGVWYEDSNSCEINSLSEIECLQKGGEFNPCASACRHNPKADVCTMQCVLTCTFR